MSNRIKLRLYFVNVIMNKKSVILQPFKKICLHILLKFDILCVLGLTRCLIKPVNFLRS